MHLMIGVNLGLQIDQGPIFLFNFIDGLGIGQQPVHFMIVRRNVGFICQDISLIFRFVGVENGELLIIVGSQAIDNLFDVDDAFFLTNDFKFVFFQFLF